MASTLLNKYRKSASMDNLVANMGKLTENQKIVRESDDPAFWYPAVDKVGNGYAVVRFLPPPEGEDDAIVRRFSHGFQGPSGRWYIENSRTTIGDRDPVSELNSRLWNNGQQDLARAQKRNLEYFTNVYVVRDKEHPENEGKVFVFKFGKRIFDKIQGAMKPKFEDEKPINPFDLFTGADLKIKISLKDGYRNYDDSTFDAPSEFLSGNEAAMEKALSQLHSIAKYVAADQFKSYDELKAKLDSVLGDAPVASVAKVTVAESDIPFDGPYTKQTQKAPPKAKTQKPAEPDEDDEILAKLRGELAGLDID